jgi:MOSC domain-containing protein YiiM
MNSLPSVQADLEDVRRSPTGAGRVELIVRRPAEDEREVLAGGYLDINYGLVGDGWARRSGNRDRQVTIMNSRVAALLAPRERWALAGDQFFVDLDLSQANLPPGSQLSIGRAALEISDDPHLGCKKFAVRFGTDALRLVNSQLGRQLCLRGLNARVIRRGLVRLGDRIGVQTRPVPQLASVGRERMAG